MKFFFRLYFLIRFAVARQLAIGQFGGTVLMSFNILGDLGAIRICNWKFQEFETTRFLCFEDSSAWNF